MNICWYCLEIIPKSASLWVIGDIDELCCEACYLEYLERRSLNEHFMRYGV